MIFLKQEVTKWSSPWIPEGKSWRKWHPSIKKQLRKKKERSESTSLDTPGPLPPGFFLIMDGKSLSPDETAKSIESLDPSPRDVDSQSTLLTPYSQMASLEWVNEFWNWKSEKLGFGNNNKEMNWNISGNVEGCRYCFFYTLYKMMYKSLKIVYRYFFLSF